MRIIAQFSESFEARRIELRAARHELGGKTFVPAVTWEELPPGELYARTLSPLLSFEKDSDVALTLHRQLDLMIGGGDTSKAAHIQTLLAEVEYLREVVSRLIGERNVVVVGQEGKRL